MSTRDLYNTIADLKADLLEAYKSIVEEYRKEADYDFHAECNFCGAEESYKSNYTITHEADCIVNKANKYIEGIKW